MFALQQGLHNRFGGPQLTATSDLQQTPKQEAVDRQYNMEDFEKNALKGGESVSHRNTVATATKALVHAIVWRISTSKHSSEVNTGHQLR